MGVSQMKRLFFLILASMCLAIFFANNPEVDLDVSKLFFSEKHHKFPLAQNPILKTIAYSAFVFVFFTLSINALLILRTFIKTRSYNFQLYKKEVFVLLVFLIGSIILIEGIIKPYFGRARPYTVQEFGGELEFAPAFKVSRQCHPHSVTIFNKTFETPLSNCSFVSFHTSLGLLLISFALVLTKRRRLGVALAVGFAILLMITRVSQGEHFLSDVVLSACLMSIVINVLFLLLKMEKELEKANVSG
jgi:lipid A 4'-phosphatase